MGGLGRVAGVPRPPLTKRLAQHHLASPDLCRPLVDWLRPEGARVVEIGPGGGVLTRALLEAGARSVTAVELDRAWAFELRRRLGSEARLEVAVADALDLDWRAARSPFLVAGNLPYNVATPLLERLLTGAMRLERAAFLVQWEVGLRLTAEPGTRAWGSLTVLAASYADLRLIGRVRAGSFRPPPRVDGAFVGLEPREPPLPREAMAEFLLWARSLLGLRRKTVGNVLGRLWGKRAAREALVASGIDPGLRAETLPLGELLRLYGAGPAAAAGRLRR